jgi:hypothetical protein
MTTLEENLAAARAAVHEAGAEHERLRRERSKRAEVLDAEIIKPARVRVGQILAEEFNAKTNAAFVRFDEAEAALLAARIALAETDPRLGTTLVEWGRNRNRWRPTWGKTGRTGVVQILRPGDPRADKASYTSPQDGDLVIRPLLKDRTPGKIVIRIGYAPGWCPEGVDPNVPREEA